GARLVVHPRGARHLIDPSKLAAGARAVYGEERFARLYGELVPVPAERVIEAGDRFTLSLNGRRLLFLDTPGHARHHFCVQDELSGGIFAGVTFGISYRELDGPAGPFIFPPTTPVQFDPAAWRASVERLLELRPQRIYLTHFGMVEDPAPLARQLLARIDEAAALALEAGGEDAGGDIRRALEASLWSGLRRQGCPLSREQALAILANDIDLNTQGLVVWLEAGAASGSGQVRGTGGDGRAGPRC
ncbi:MAG: MBL fold metallo-hydrolase, partial [Acidobacteriota bacterium]|nr:MBL fold metallo-hydrolase [Acidobacteriota bacterium]